jgi:ATP-dependent Clp protease ATP-binding subunit ClpC
MFDRFSTGSRKLMGIARAEASNLGHDFIDAEHLLLGILRDKGSAGVTVLRAVGGKPEDMREKLLRLMPDAKKSAPGGQLPFTGRAKTVLQMSLEEAESLGHQQVGTGHVLLGLLKLQDGAVSEVLAGIDPEAIRKDVSQGTEHGTMSLGNLKAGTSPGILRLIEELLRRVDDLENRVRKLEE